MGGVLHEFMGRMVDLFSLAVQPVFHGGGHSPAEGRGRPVLASGYGQRYSRHPEVRPLLHL